MVEEAMERGVTYFYRGALRTPGMATGIRRMAKSRRADMVIVMHTHARFGYGLTRLIQKGLRKLDIESYRCPDISHLKAKHQLFTSVRGRGVVVFEASLFSQPRECPFRQHILMKQVGKERELEIVHIVRADSSALASRADRYINPWPVPL